jgi:hypothetical protein
MNLGEGMRRLAILVGAVGAITGGCIGYIAGNATGVWATLSAHRGFESAMALPTMQNVVKESPALFVGPPASDTATTDLDALATKYGGRRVLPQQGQFTDKNIATPYDFSGPKPKPPAGFELDPHPFSQPKPTNLPPGAVLIDPYSAYNSKPYGWIVPNHPERLDSLLKDNRDGINGVHFDSQKRVVSIEFISGDRVERTDTPKFSAYLFVLAFPVGGFLIPWGVIRALSWVLTGFSRSTE